MNWQWTSIDKLELLPEDKFLKLQAADELTSPFLSHAFLLALEQTACVGDKSGWQVKHLIIYEQTNNEDAKQNKLVSQTNIIAFLPAYKKSHSYGEYVFDHSWAHAYQQHGLAYYPKLVNAIPFTPVTGPRLLLANDVEYTQVVNFLARNVQHMLTSLRVSSLHILFSSQDQAHHLALANFHKRQSVQFNWHNRNYDTFDDFLASMTARRRRSIKKERKGILKQKLEVVRKSGSNINLSDIQFFYQCYKQTYLKRSGHSGYLSAEFFVQLFEKMTDNLLLVIAYKDDKPIAAALFLYDENGLYGRYWGALQEISGLHFEVCYYQGIEFCIANKIALFNPGTQGEHKILRGFEPTLCYSNHRMKENAFDDAVKDFLNRETPHIKEYARQTATLLPYKSEQGD